MQQTSNVQFLVGDSHARADIYAWNPHVQLPALLNKQAVTYAEHMVDNPRGMLPTHLDAFERRDRLPLCSFAWGTAMHGHKHVHGHYWNPTNSCKLKLNMWQTTHRVRQFFMQIYWRERWDTLPMCSFLWGTAMHGRTPVSGTPMCRCPPPPFKTQRTGGNSC